MTEDNPPAHPLEGNCPHCGYHVDMASNVPGEDHKPVSGDVTMCIECGQFSFICDDHALRKPDLKELLELSLNPEIMRLHHAWQMAKQKQRRRS